MHLLPEPLFVLPTDSLQTRTLAGTDNGRSVLLLAGFRIRIRIILSCWIRIRIRIADPDPGGQKWPT
jgi:hypothetical protein